MSKEGMDDDKFCIGATTGYMFWWGRRAGLKPDRGPWCCPIDYLRSTAQKEIEWTQHYGEPIEPDFPQNAIGLGMQQPEQSITSNICRTYKVLTVLSNSPAPDPKLSPTRKKNG
jgi:hypothetical protein